MTYRIFCAVLLLGLVAGTSSAQEVKTVYGVGGVEFIAEADFASAKLVVAGPDGFRRELAFNPGDSLFLDYAELGLKSLSNGTYKFELQLSALPMLTGEDAKLVGEMRAEGKDVSFAAAPAMAGAFGSFSVTGGQIVDRDLVEQVNEKVQTGQKDQVFLDDIIVDGSACIGFDCVNGESFGFDTLRLKENNLRVKFQDTSTSASFPTRDWQLTANDTSNGGQEKFSIDDIDGGRTPFTLEAGAPSHSLYVDDGGRVGFGTSTPVADLHVKSGNTPTLRLEQDGSSGFTPQTWDVAGNEANFFIRDATNGSTLPLRIFPGAPSNALTIEASTGDIGMGTTSPDEELDIEGSDDGGEIKIKVQNTADGGNAWAVSVTDGGSSNIESEFRISKQGTGFPEITINEHSDGNATGDATLVVVGSVEATNVTFTSSREKKTDFEAVDSLAILDGVASLEMASWQYKEGSPGRHIGPIAEDFDEIFGLGSGGKTISVVDANGVALAAIQGLHTEMQTEIRQRDGAIEVLSGQIAELQGQINSLSKR